MTLFEKFDAIEIQNDTRISDTDREFCKRQQAAYTTAKSDLEKLKDFWKSISERQSAFLTESDYGSSVYLSGLSLSESKINDQICSLHDKLIEQIIRYFNNTYSISVSQYEISKVLLPQKPDYGWYSYNAEEYEKYENELLSLVLKYEDIVERIFEQTDGNGLWEQALYELKEKCRSAAWRYGSPKYERKKNVVQFSDSSYGDWELCEGMKNILRGIIHYETGSFTITPADFNTFFIRGRQYTDTFEFPLRTKISKIRIFKNGRVDLKFSDESAAITFIEEYLGTVKS